VADFRQIIKDILANGRVGSNGQERYDQGRAGGMGHDAWVVGNEPVIWVDWSGTRDYAKRKQR
jgi:hypothetical protein